MLITVVSNEAKHAATATEILMQLLAFLNFETKTVADLAEYKPFSMKAGDEGFSNWIISDFDTPEKLDKLKDLKAFKILVTDQPVQKANLNGLPLNYVVEIYNNSSKILYDDLRAILVKEKIIYP